MLATSSVALFVVAGLRSTQHRRQHVKPIGLEGDVEETAAMLSSNIREWLDEEWIEQDCHERIGVRVSEAYRAARLDGVDDLGVLLVRLGTALGGDGPTAASTVSDFAEAYVGPWDVANKASDILAQLATGETTCCDDLTRRAEELRREAAALEKELEPAEAAPRPSVEIPGSRWRLSCALEQRRRFVVEVELTRGDRPDDGDVLGNVTVLSDPSGLALDATAWRTEVEVDGKFVRFAVRPPAGLLEEGDGDTLYFNARVVQLADGALTLEEGALTVKRAETVRFLFVEYPSLLARFTVVGRFSATPLPVEP